MTLHAPEGAPTPSRRALRERVASDAVVGDAPIGRAELRRRAAAGATASPTVVWARPAVVEPVAVVVEAAEIDEVPATPLTRRTARATQPAVLPEALPVVEATAIVSAAEVLVGEPITSTAQFELLEPVDIPVVLEPAIAEPETVWNADAQPAASVIDEFEAAARLFSFTGETPIQTPSPASSGSSFRAASPDVAKKPVRSASHPLRRMAAASFSVGVMSVVGLMAVGMTTPAQAVAAVSGDDAVAVVEPASKEAVEAAEAEQEEIQAYVASSDVENVELNRDAGGYDTATLAEIASEEGIANFSALFSNDPNAAIQWPFAVGVPMTYGFGWRGGEFHEGIDFTPGAGAPIQAIADGVVRIATEAGGGFGVHVVIDHVIDGEVVASHYAHMQYGSLQVSPGEHVKVGQLIGRVGNTGYSFGAHLHFEIWQAGTTPIDPLPWMREHTGG